jgi:hypothetical protein
LVADELLHIIHDTEWRSMEKVPNQNVTVEWSHSKAYGRDLIKFTASTLLRLQHARHL